MCRESLHSGFNHACTDKLDTHWNTVTLYFLWDTCSGVRLRHENCLRLKDGLSVL